MRSKNKADILSKIIEHKRIEVESQKSECGLDLNQLEVLCRELPPVISFIDRIRSNSDKIALIAEVKKASPSKGIIRDDFDPLDIALSYKHAGASAISVLTDENFFQGKIEYLKLIKSAVDLPVLRKDFIIDAFQIYQTRLIGADLILLIASAMDFSTLKEFYNLSIGIGLEVLLEVHNKEEMDQAFEIGAKLIGINNRNLETFDVNINNSVSLVKGRDLKDKFIISESGIGSYNDIVFLKNNGISGVLVGESLMRKQDIKKAVADLLGDLA